MKTFLQWLKEEMGEGIVGIYPPGYDGLANYPPEYFNPSNLYIRISRKTKTDQEKPHKKRKKKKKK